jgi:ArsR family transcriptional regulator
MFPVPTTTTTTTTTLELCCAPVLTEVPSEEDAAELAAAFKVLSDPSRLRLLSMIANASSAEACVCDLVEAIDRSQPTVSHHLSLLAGAGLIEREKRGKWAWYRVVPARLEMLREALSPPA